MSHAERLREMAEQHDKYAARWATHPSITSSPVAMRCKKLHEDDAAALRAGAEALERETEDKAPKSMEEMARIPGQQALRVCAREPQRLPGRPCLPGLWRMGKLTPATSLIRNGEWTVPPEQRPAGWQSIPLAPPRVEPSSAGWEGIRAQIVAATERGEFLTTVQLPGGAERSDLLERLRAWPETSRYRWSLAVLGEGVRVKRVTGFGANTLAHKRRSGL